MVTALEVQVVRFDARGGRPRERGHAAGAQRDFELAGDLARDVVLDREHVVELTIVPLGPELITAGDVDQLRGDAELLPRSAHAALEDGRHVERRADVAHADVLAFEGERRRARRNLQVFHLGDRVDQFFGNAVAEVLHLRVAARVDEWQHGDRRRAERLAREHAPRRGVGYPPSRFCRRLAQRRRELARRREPIHRLLREAALHDVDNRGRDQRVDAIERRRPLENRVHRLDRRRLLEGARAGQQLEDQQADGEQIRSLVGEFAADLLRRHVRRRSDHDAGRGDERRLGAVGVGAQHLLEAAHVREAEVENLDPAVGGDEHVVRLEIAMADAALVRRHHALDDVARVAERHVQRRRTVELDEPLPQRLSVQPLHDDVRLVVGDAELVDRDDVGMVQGGRRLRLALEAGDLLRVGRGRQQDLDGDGAIELGVLREEHLAHAAGAYLLDDPVVCNTLPDHVSSAAREA